MYALPGYNNFLKHKYPELKKQTDRTPINILKDP